MGDNNMSGVMSPTDAVRMDDSDCVSLGLYSLSRVSRVA